MSQQLIWKQTYKNIETERIRNHLENTERWMRSKDISHLTEEEKKSRENIIRLLHEYWVEKQYPLNTDFPMLRLPHIKDKFGTPCAMAYIIEKAEGIANPQLVKSLNETVNNVFIKDVNEGPLIEWIDNSGITKEEACQIQPSYGFLKDPEFQAQIKRARINRDLKAIKATKVTNRRAARRRALQIRAKEKALGRLIQAKRIRDRRAARKRGRGRTVTREFTTKFRRSGNVIIIEPKPIKVTTKVQVSKRQLRQEALSRKLIARRKARSEAFRRKKEARKAAAQRKIKRIVIRRKRILALRTGTR